MIPRTLKEWSLSSIKALLDANWVIKKMVRKITMNSTCDRSFSASFDCTSKMASSESSKVSAFYVMVTGQVEGCQVRRKYDSIAIWELTFLFAVIVTPVVLLITV